MLIAAASFFRGLWLPRRNLAPPLGPRAALDGGGPRSHGAAMTVARNRFFGICREIICA
jgi:hypothetical protein